YGLLLGALGAGALIGAFTLPRLRTRLSDNRMLVAAAFLYGAAMVVLVLVRDPVAGFLALVPAGAAWVTVIAGGNTAVQLMLPGWVRARGLAAFQMVLFGSQAVGALIWGLVAQYGGLTLTFLAAAGLLVAGAASVRIWPLFDVRKFNPDLSVHWPEP